MKLMMILAATVVLIASRAEADDGGVRRAGEWQVTTIGENGKANPPKTFCFPERSVADIFKTMDSCSKQDINRSGDTTIVDAICKKGAEQISLQMTIKSTSDTSYHAETHSTYSPAIGGTSQIHSVSDSKWLGPCPAGQPTQ